MQSIFDEIIVNSFREVVEKSIAEFFSGKGLSAFQQEYRDGMNEIGTFIQQRLIEFIDQELVADPPTLRERVNWYLVINAMMHWIFAAAMADMIFGLFEAKGCCQKFQN
jgi:hypothetical protein